MGEIFDVYPNSSRSQNCLDRSYYFFGGLTDYGDSVNRESDREDLSDSFDSRHKFITTNSLAIRVAERYHKSRARGCNRWEPFILKDARTWDIPCVRKNQNPFSMVESTKILSLILLGSHLGFRQDAGHVSSHLSSFASRIGRDLAEPGCQTFSQVNHRAGLEVCQSSQISSRRPSEQTHVPGLGEGPEPL